MVSTNSSIGMHAEIRRLCLGDPALSLQPLSPGVPLHGAAGRQGVPRHHHPAVLYRQAVRKALKNDTLCKNVCFGRRFCVAGELPPFLCFAQTAHSLHVKNAKNLCQSKVRCMKLQQNYIRIKKATLAVCGKKRYALSRPGSARRKEIKARNTM